MLKTSPAPVQIIDAAYIGQTCPACEGTHWMDDGGGSATHCTVCDGEDWIDVCPCGDVVPMTFVPDAHHIRLCVACGWEAETEALRLLDGRSPAEDGSCDCGAPRAPGDAVCSACRAEMLTEAEFAAMIGYGPGDVEEDATVEVEAQSMDELVNGRRAVG